MTITQEIKNVTFSMLVSLAKVLFYLDVWILNPKGGQKYCSKPIYNYTSAINNMCQESCKVDWILEEPCTAYVMLSLGAQAKFASAHYFNRSYF